MSMSALDDTYEPYFPPLGPTRRVLMHITDEDHVQRGPRNTVARLAVELAEDPHSPDFVLDEPSCEGLVRDHVAALSAAGLVNERADGTLIVTAAGKYELLH